MAYTPTPPNNTGKKYHVRPTTRQRKFAALVVGGKSARSAAMEAGYSKATAKNANRNIVEKRGFQSVLEQLPNAHIMAGNTPQMIAEKIAEFRQAQITIRVGKSTLLLPDYTTRTKAIELWIKSLELCAKGH